MSKHPERACILIARIDADDRASIIAQLQHIVRELEFGRVGSPWISAGSSSGHILSYTENEGPTHDEYFAELNAYLESQRAADQTSEVPK